jgi:hypothetical protein
MFGFGGNSAKKLEDELFNLKFFSKQLQREAKKAEKEMAKEKAKVKKVRFERGSIGFVLAAFFVWVRICPLLLSDAVILQMRLFSPGYAAACQLSLCHQTHLQGFISW